MGREDTRRVGTGDGTSFVLPRSSEVFRRVPVSARDSYFFAARARRSVAWL